MCDLTENSCFWPSVCYRTSCLCAAAAVPLVVDSIVKLEFKMRYDEGGLKVTTTHLSRASIFPVYPALLVRGLIVITPYNEWIEYMDTNCMQICHTMSGTYR